MLLLDPRSCIYAQQRFYEPAEQTRLSCLRSVQTPGQAGGCGEGLQGRTLRRLHPLVASWGDPSRWPLEWRQPSLMGPRFKHHLHKDDTAPCSLTPLTSVPTVT